MLRLACRRRRPDPETPRVLNCDWLLTSRLQPREVTARSTSPAFTQAIGPAPALTSAWDCIVVALHGQARLTAGHKPGRLLTHL